MAKGNGVAEKNGELKLKDLVMSELSLSSLVDEKMKAKDSFKLARIIWQISPIIEDFQEARDKLIMKYGTEQDDGSFNIPENSKEYEVYADELTALLEEDVKVDFKKLNISQISSAEISARDLASLRWLINE